MWAQLSCMHSNLETKMCPCINSFRPHSTLSNASARTFVRISMNSHSVAGTGPNTPSTWITKKTTQNRAILKWKYPEKRRNKNARMCDAFFTYAHVSVRTNCRVVSTWFTTYIQLPGNIFKRERESGRERKRNENFCVFCVFESILQNAMYLDYSKLPAALYIDRWFGTVALFRHFVALADDSSVDHLIRPIHFSAMLRTVIVALDLMALAALLRPMNYLELDAQNAFAMTHHGHIYGNEMRNWIFFLYFLKMKKWVELLI